MTTKHILIQCPCCGNEYSSAENPQLCRSIVAKGPLIAAAPEMFEALRDCSDLLQQLRQSGKVTDQCLSVLNTARAILATLSTTQFTSPPAVLPLPHNQNA